MREQEDLGRCIGENGDRALYPPPAPAPVLAASAQRQGTALEGEVYGEPQEPDQSSTGTVDSENVL